MKFFVVLIFLQVFALHTKASWCSRSAAKISSLTSPFHKAQKKFLENDQLFLDLLKETKLAPDGPENTTYWLRKTESQHFKRIYKLFKKIDAKKSKDKNVHLSTLEIRNLAIALSPFEFPYPPFLSWRIKHFQYKKFLEEAIAVRAEQIILEEKLKSFFTARNILMKENVLHSARLALHRWKPFLQTLIHTGTITGGFFLLQSDAMLEFSRFFPIYGPMDLAFLSLAPLLLLDIFDAPSFYYRDLNKNFISLYQTEGKKVLAEKYMAEHPVLHAKEKTKYISKSLLSPLNLISYAFLGHMIYSMTMPYFTTSTKEYITKGLEISQQIQKVQELKLEAVDSLEEVRNYQVKSKNDPYPLRKLLLSYNLELSTPEAEAAWLQLVKHELVSVYATNIIAEYKAFFKESYGRFPDEKEPDDYERFPSWVESNTK
ncbi:MAG: hypothetical protein VX583_03200 [Bdellovibrionota bacterium]